MHSILAPAVTPTTMCAPTAADAFDRPAAAPAVAALVLTVESWLWRQASAHGDPGPAVPAATATSAAPAARTGNAVAAVAAAATSPDTATTTSADGAVATSADLTASTFAAKPAAFRRHGQGFPPRGAPV